MTAKKSRTDVRTGGGRINGGGNERWPSRGAGGGLRQAAIAVPTQRLADQSLPECRVKQWLFFNALEGDGGLGRFD